MALRHFLTLRDLSTAELNRIIERAQELKRKQHNNEVFQPFVGKVMGMIFEKSSTRTRVSFEAGMSQFGGSAIFLSSRDTQLGRGEPIEDSARVISSMLDIVMIRTFGHDIVERFAEYSTVPVINALTDDHHPCQLLADVQTFVEHRGSINGKTVAWIGDGNNMCNSYIEAAHMWGFKLKIASPKGYEPKPEFLSEFAHCVELFESAEDAAVNADLIVTDVWASMGQEEEQKIREKAFSAYQVNEKLMDLAHPDCLFMHCLPAHRGEEVSENMLDHKNAVVWDEAENRLHAQKALVEFLINGKFKQRLNYILSIKISTDYGAYFLFQYNKIHTFNMCIIQMKFKIIPLFAMSVYLLISQNSYATELDDYLIQKKLIGQHYKIIDQQNLDDVLTALSEEDSRVLPVQIDQNTVIEKIHMYHDHVDLQGLITSADFNQFSNSVGKEKTLQLLMEGMLENCHLLFENEFQRQNPYYVKNKTDV